jgi:hypothetical protein
MMLIWREQGRLGEVAPLVEPLLEEAVHPGAAKLRALFAIDRGTVDELSTVLGPDPLPRSRDFTWLAEMCVTAEGVAAGRLPCAGELYDLLVPFAHRVVTMDATYVCLGSAELYLGLLAEALGDTDGAGRHLAASVAVNDQIGAVPWSVRSRAALAHVVAPHDPVQAGELRREALATADHYGLVAMATALRRELEAPGPS